MELKFLTFILILLFLAALAGGQTNLTKPTLEKENAPPNTSSLYTWWDLRHYSIDLQPDLTTKSIVGTNVISLQAITAGHELRIDLEEPMQINSITCRGKILSFVKTDGHYKVQLLRDLMPGDTTSIAVKFWGKPTETTHAPWSSGWVWTKDKLGRPWVSVACEGSGAAIWLPCKNVLYDEPDLGVLFKITVPDSLVAVANGRVISKSKSIDHKITYTWQVLNPINGYDIIPCIGKYVTWHKSYRGLKGSLDCDFWVLDYNYDKAKQHFKQVDTMLRCFEYWMGPYPFYEDSYKVVEVSFPGMEHQSSIAYGNNFENGYTRANLSGTKWGLLWDFILVHESGHEWFGNSITGNSDGESWIHEGFTKYLETLYTEFLFGKEAATEYSNGIWKRILNDQPVIGSGTSDTYNKASAMLHMIRQIVGDSAFRSVLYGLCAEFYHTTLSSESILSYINSATHEDFSKVFDQYLRTVDVPKFEYQATEKGMKYRWANCVTGFNMPLNISIDAKPLRMIHPTTEWQLLDGSSKESSLAIDKNFYIRSAQIQKE